MELPSREELRRWAAPAAVLLGLTIVVLLIHRGLSANQGPPTTATPVVSVETHTRPQERPATTTSTAAATYYTVGSGDTFGSIAAKEGTTVTELERLNPSVSSNELSVGQQIRVK